MKLREVFSRANSTFRLWSYRRNRPNPLSLRWAIREWFRRIRFELRIYFLELM